jgi:error-prone DNA polymerase
MNKFSIVLSILCLALIGVLFYLHFTHTEKLNKVSDEATKNAHNNFRIAYFDIDSLQTKYERYNDMLEELKKTEQSHNARLNALRAGYQSFVGELQKSGPGMTQAQQEQAHRGPNRERSERPRTEGERARHGNLARSSTAGLPAMSPEELTEADYRMTGVSLNGHPMLHLRSLLEPSGVLTADHLARHARDNRVFLNDGQVVAVAGLVICRQRPGTAKGFVFLTLEDETGMVNVVITPQRFERQALLISTTPLLLVRGVLQIEQGVVNVRAKKFRALQAELGAEYAKSHDFH